MLNWFYAFERFILNNKNKKVVKALDLERSQVTFDGEKLCYELVLFINFQFL